MWRTGTQDVERGATWRALRAMAELRGCTDATVDRIDDLATPVTRPAGTVIQRRGQELRQLVLVLEGTLAEQAGSGRTVRAGGLVGADPLEGAHVAEATVVATSDVRLLVFGPDEIAEARELVQSRGGTRIRAAAAGARVRVLAPAPS